MPNKFGHCLHRCSLGFIKFCLSRESRGEYEIPRIRYTIDREKKQRELLEKSIEKNARTGVVTIGRYGKNFVTFYSAVRKIRRFNEPAGGVSALEKCYRPYGHVLHGKKNVGKKNSQSKL